MNGDAYFLLIRRYSMFLYVSSFFLFLNLTKKGPYCSCMDLCHNSGPEELCVHALKQLCFLSFSFASFALELIIYLSKIRLYDFGVCNICLSALGHLIYNIVR